MENNRFVAFFDGCCEPVNPGGTAAFGWVLYSPEGGKIQERSEIIGHGDGMTNNVAEYAGLQSLLEFIDASVNFPVEIYGDSDMVINMARGTWGKKNPHKKAPHLLPALLRCREILSRRTDISLEWISREENLEADALSKAHIIV